MGKGNPAITVAIGDPVSSNWSLTTHVMEADKTELDVGNIQLKQKVR